jgi:RNA polymerase sigma-70 factor (ECF subfamily)
MPDKDAQLINDYLKGDEKSLEILIIKYLTLVYGFVFNYVKNEADASDIAQNVFLKMWKNLKKYNFQKGSFKSWILQIAKNTSLDFIKKKKTVPFSDFIKEDEKNPLLETLFDSEPLPDEKIEQMEVVSQLDSATKNLSEKDQMIISLRHEKDLSFQEIADVLNKPLNTVKSQYWRAVAKLKNNFKESF